MIQLDALLIDQQKLKDGAGVLRALNNKLRQVIIKSIDKSGKTNVTSLYRKLRLEQSLVSQHLRILREARFVKTEREGKEVFYSINYDRFEQVDKLIKELSQ